MWRRSGAPDNALDATTTRLLQPQAVPPPRPLALCVAASLPVLERALCSTLCLLGAIGLGCVPRLPLLLVVAITALSCAATATHLGPSGAVLWLLVASVTPGLPAVLFTGATSALADNAGRAVLYVEPDTNARTSWLVGVIAENALGPCIEVVRAMRQTPCGTFTAAA